MERLLAEGPLATALAFALVGLLPLAFVGLTAFAKVSTVLTIARTALGAHGIPSNVVVLALSAALSLVAMAPVGTAMAERAAPVLEQERPGTDVLLRAADAAREPLVRFLRGNASTQEIERLHGLARSTYPVGQRDAVSRDDLIVLAPAFLITELIEAFMIGFAIFLPFLIVDFVVASVLAALGAQALGPAHVSLPFKLLLFVAADGWGLLAQTLVSGYVPG
jgi:type III secretion protein R